MTSSGRNIHSPSKDITHVTKVHFEYKLHFINYKILRERVNDPEGESWRQKWRRHLLQCWLLLFLWCIESLRV